MSETRRTTPGNRPLRKLAFRADDVAVHPWAALWRYVAGVVACAVIGFFPYVEGRRVPLLGMVDLGFHELGHLLTYPLPELVTAVMGSVTQVAVPLGLAAYFWLRSRDHLGVGLCWAWAGASAWDVGVYIADAPYQRLPLIGGEHDWAFLLGPSGLDNLGASGPLAAAATGLGALLVLAGIGACFVGPFAVRGRRDPIVSVPGPSGVIREPRQWSDPGSQADVPASRPPVAPSTASGWRATLRRESELPPRR